MSAWIDQIFEAASAANGSVVRRARADVEKQASVPELYQDVSDIALVYDLTLNKFLEMCIRSQVDEELKNPRLQKAIERNRALRAERDARVEGGK